MKKNYIILKLFAFIFIIKASFLFSFAFIGDGLGLDLYKNIDSGILKLNSQMYSHELKGGKVDGDITENINKKIKRAGLGGCELSNITEEEIEKIAFGEKDGIEKSPNLGLLRQKIEGKKCNNSIRTLNRLQLIIYNTSLQSLKTAKTKSEEIYNISKIGLFSDGNIQNSPFDIVKDIKDIDYIIFTQEIAYEGEQNIGDNQLGDYLEGELNKLENNINDNINDIINGNNNNNNGNNGGDTEINDELSPDILNGVDSGYINISGDDTQYSCPEGENDSGLSPEDLEEILSNNNNGGNNGMINGSFVEKKPLSNNPFSFSTSGNYSIGGEVSSLIQTKPFLPVNDNDFFGGCETFFCITVEFLTHRGNLLIGGKTRSIESIMERSNNHLKKFANSSLLQSKMTNNNFELGLRDLDLSNLFSMPIVIIKKTPPILDLDFFNKKVDNEKNKKTDPNPLSRQNLLKARFDSVGIDIERENDLSIYENRDTEIKSIINNSELGLSQIKKNSDERKKQIEKMLELDEHITRVVNSNYQYGDTKGLYKEFIEFERFSSEIQDYVNSLDKVANKMIKIPINP